MLNVGMPTEQFFEKVKTGAIQYIEIPAMAPYEVKWSTKQPENPEEKIELTSSYAGAGPALIAVLID